MQKTTRNNIKWKRFKEIKNEGQGVCRRGHACMNMRSCEHFKPKNKEKMRPLKVKRNIKEHC